MINVEAPASIRIESRELLPEVDALPSDCISLQELDKPIALHGNSELGGSSDNAAMESCDLLPTLDASSSDAISVQEIDEPIALHKRSQMEGFSDNTQIVDASDKSVITIICRNQSLAGDQHPITGVRFEQKIITIDEQHYEVVVPQFEYDFKTTLPDDVHLSSDRTQFDCCNKGLKAACASDPDLQNKFTPEQIEQIENGDRPDGYVWHHAENPGEMQLVKKEDHDQTGHTGGKAIWGGGSENR